MSEKPNQDAWQEVGRQLAALGESLAGTFRTAWESEKDDEKVQQMQDGLEAMVQRVGQAIDEVGRQADAHNVRGEAQKAAESIHKAGRQTWQEVQPQLASALEQVNQELQRVIHNIRESGSNSE